MPHLLIEAGPGSGKTTTLEHSYLFLLSGTYAFTPSQEQVNICHMVRSLYAGTPASSCVFVAFNTDIKDRIQEKLPSHTKAYTFGGLGQSILFKRHGFQQLGRNRGQDLLSDILGKNITSLPYKERLYYFNMLKYLQACKEELLNPTQENLAKIHTKYRFPPPPDNLGLMEQLLNTMRLPNRKIEFIDQVWMGLQAIHKPHYKLAFVDEAQDLSALRLEFVLRVAENVVFCGDGFQSINAFAGADHTAFEKLRTIAQETLPLKQSFRLPPNHIDYANRIRPARITAFKTKPGPIETIRLENLADKLNVFLKNPPHSFAINPPYKDKDGNMIDSVEVPPNVDITNPKSHMFIGRTNADIFRIGIHLLKKGINARIVRRKEDEDIKKMLLSYFDQCVGKLSQQSTKLFKQLLDRDILRSKTMPFKQGLHLYEKASCLLSLCEEVERIEQIPLLVETLTAETGNSVRCATIHKSKGLEAPFVYIIFPPVKHPRAETEQEIEQETNLEFVSETRSQFYKAYIKD